MEIEYKIDAPVSVDQFIELLRASTLGARRPIDDRECMAGMVGNSNLMVTAWNADALVGIARSVTDFHYACYLSDLAVHRDHQRSGIGRQLIALTQSRLGPHCKLILLAAPAADSYYAHLGFARHAMCWILGRDQRLRT